MLSNREDAETTAIEYGLPTGTDEMGAGCLVLSTIGLREMKALLSMFDE